MKLSLSWPPKELHSNSRAHYMAKARATRKYRAECAYVAMSEGWHLHKPVEGPFPLTLTFCPPDKRRRDQHNMPTAMKAGLDGLADALGVDDYNFRVTYAWGEPVKGGAVLVEVTP